MYQLIASNTYSQQENVLFIECRQAHFSAQRMVEAVDFRAFVVFVIGRLPSEHVFARLSHGRHDVDGGAHIRR